MRNFHLVLTAMILAFGVQLASALPSDQELSQLMVGAWRSPRHDYIFQADGTWWMGQPDPQATHGKWSIKDGVLIESYLGNLSKMPEMKNPIRVLNQKEILFGEKFRMQRIDPKDVTYIFPQAHH